ncbi:MAG TPA: UDP-N-acetylenolpyruvoylglucosamine reductase, partial [Ghiorsea sp.]|nr:UDP-N-acetylenolpyruvoylglucosamine reductase [Ghiorsea sp.]
MIDFSTLSDFGNIQADVSLASRTTLGVGGHAAWLFRPSDEMALIQAMKKIPEDTYVFPIGRGSNLLIADDGIDALVLDL